jgi:acyl-CoA thioesterase-1
MGVRTALAAFAALLIVACSGERRESSTATKAAPGIKTPAPKRSEPDTRRTVVAFGDSLSAGFGVDATQSFPAHLQRELDARGLAWRVINEGISGDTTTGGLARLDVVLSNKPDVVILELGGNDGLRGLPLEVTRSNLEQMIVAIQKSGAKVLLAGITLPPNYGQDYISRFEAIYRELASKYKTVLIPFLLEGVATGEFMQPDGIHPTAEGNRRVAALVMKHLEPLLR